MSYFCHQNIPRSPISGNDIYGDINFIYILCILITLIKTSSENIIC